MVFHFTPNTHTHPILKNQKLKVGDGPMNVGLVTTDSLRLTLGNDKLRQGANLLDLSGIRRFSYGEGGLAVSRDGITILACLGRSEFLRWPQPT